MVTYHNSFQPLIWHMLAHITVLDSNTNDMERREIQSTKIGGVTFDLLEVQLKDDNLDFDLNVHNLIQDEFSPGRLIIISEGLAVYTINITSEEIHLIAGQHSTSGYQEGQGEMAKFSRIQTVITSPISQPNNLWLVDRGCIRNVNRLTNITSHFTGQCIKDGDTDGIVSSAETGTLCDIVKDPNNQIYYTFDLDSKSLKTIKYNAKLSKWTLKKNYTFHKKDADFVKTIKHLTFDPLGVLIYFCSSKGDIWRYKPATGQTDMLFHSSLDNTIDGIDDLIFIRSWVMIIITLEGKVFAIELGTEKGDYVCDPDDSRKCLLNMPHSLLDVPSNNTVLIGGDHTIYSLTYTDLNKGSSILFTTKFPRQKKTIKNVITDAFCTQECDQETFSVTRTAPPSLVDALERTKAQLQGGLVAIGFAITILIIGSIMVLTVRARNRRMRSQESVTDASTAVTPDRAYTTIDINAQNSSSDNKSRRKKNKTLPKRQKSVLNASAANKGNPRGLRRPSGATIAGNKNLKSPDKLKRANKFIRRDSKGLSRKASQATI